METVTFEDDVRNEGFVKFFCVDFKKLFSVVIYIQSNLKY